MHFTNVFSVIAAYTLFATANAAAVHDDLTGEFSNASVFVLTPNILPISQSLSPALKV